MTASAVVVFARAPQPGLVKTRLAAHFGDVAATQLYGAMLRDTLNLAAKVTKVVNDCEVHLAYTPADAFAPGAHSLAPFWSGARLAQHGKNLGERMLNAFQTLFGQGAQRVVLIGSDSPDLPLEYMCEAFAQLKENDLTFGPAHDGGFYLIGAPRPFSALLFKNVMWSTSHTLQSVLVNASLLELSCAALPPWNDIDEPGDVLRLAQRLNETQAGSGAAPLTRAFLNSFLAQTRDDGKK